MTASVKELNEGQEVIFRPAPSRGLSAGEMADLLGVSSYDTAIPAGWRRKVHRATGFDPFGEVVYSYENSVMGQGRPLTPRAAKALREYRDQIGAPQVTWGAVIKVVPFILEDPRSGMPWMNAGRLRTGSDTVRWIREDCRPPATAYRHTFIVSAAAERLSNWNQS